MRAGRSQGETRDISLCNIDGQQQAAGSRQRPPWARRPLPLVVDWSLAATKCVVLICTAVDWSLAATKCVAVIYTAADWSLAATKCAVVICTAVDWSLAATKCVFVICTAVATARRELLLQNYVCRFKHRKYITSCFTPSQPNKHSLLLRTCTLQLQAFFLRL